MKMQTHKCLSWTRLGLLLLFMNVVFAGCTGLRGYHKVPVTFRRAAIVDKINTKKMLISTIYQQSPGFQSAADIRQIIERKCEKNEIFAELELDQQTEDWTEDQKKLKDVMELLKGLDVQTIYADSDADLVLTSAIKFSTRDRSGNDIELVTNRYGYTYPKRVYRERMGYVFELGFILFDLKTGEVLVEKTFQKDGDAQGAADSVGLFFELVGPAIDECIDGIQGPKIRTKRYLLYD